MEAAPAFLLNDQELPHDPHPEAPSDHNPPARVLWRSCFGCGWNISNPGVTGTGGFSLPPGDDVVSAFRAVQFGPTSYAFMTRDAPKPNNDFTATPYEMTADGPAVDFQDGDRLVCRYAGENSGTVNEAYIPDGDGDRENGRIPYIDLPQ